MDRKLCSVVLTCLVLTLCLAAVSVADISDADKTTDVGNVKVHSFKESADLFAGESTTITIAVSNNNATTYQVEITSSISPSNRVGTSVSEYSKWMDAGTSQTVDIEIHANSTAVSGDYTVTVNVKVFDTDSGSETAAEGSVEYPVKISTNYSSEGYFNKIMGVFPSPYNDPILSALITLGIWLVIAIILDIIVSRALTQLALKDQNDELRKDARVAGLFVLILTMMFGVPMAFRVSGIDERVIATVTDVIAVLIALNIAFIVWKLYKVIAYDLIIRRDRDDRIDDSLYPLVKMVGKIAIIVLTLSYILSVYGLDLGAIVTSAGLVTLALSLGAQSTLNQFFCGLVLLVTRPFRIGDKVKLGTSEEVLIVRKIGVMETEFKVWLNEEVQHIPNSTVMGSNIINITKNDKTYKVVDYLIIDYNADIDKAREIIMGILRAHPKIVNDGSKSEPDFRLQSMDDSALRIRISYIVYDHEVYHAVSCQVKEAIYKKFRVEGIKVPHNIVDVHTE